MAINPNFADPSVFTAGTSRASQTQQASSAKAPAGQAPRMSVEKLQEVLAQSAQSEDALFKQWGGVAGPGRPPSLSDAIEAYAVSQMDPDLAASLNQNIHLGGAAPGGAPGLGFGVPSSDAIEAFAVSQLDLTQRADLQSTLDPFGLMGPTGRGTPGLSAIQSQFLDQIAFLGMDPSLRGALGSVIQLNPV